MMEKKVLLVFSIFFLIMGILTLIIQSKCSTEMAEIAGLPGVERHRFLLETWQFSFLGGLDLIIGTAGIILAMRKRKNKLPGEQNEQEKS